MFCAHCWAPVGTHDRTCRDCGADLTAPGSVRLTDPRSIPRGVDGRPVDLLGGSMAVQATGGDAVADAVLAPDETSSPEVTEPTVPTPDLPAPGLPTPEAAASDDTSTESEDEVPPTVPSAPSPAVVDSPPAFDAPPVTAVAGSAGETGPAVTGPGWWTGAKARALDLGRRAGDARRELARRRAAAVAAVSADGPSADDLGAVRRPGMVPGPGAGSTTGEDEAAIGTVLTSELPRTGRGDAGDDLSLWDDYGVSELGRGPRVDRTASPREQARQLFGITARPTAKVLGFTVVLVATVVLLVTLMGRLLTMDAFVIVEDTPTPSDTATVAVEESSGSATTSDDSSTAGTTTTASPVRGTPSMLAGAKECDPGVWAGPQTSCVLAGAVAAEVDTTMTGSAEVEAFSTSSNRTYKLECVADRGITCTGLDGVDGVYVWIVV
ncbi:hypothetical protein GCM10009785_24870 [Brooklawnia cerclae]|nr:hypothetical protein [Brooklawnia cerclae]